jgi:hypothetical protein
MTDIVLRNFNARLILTYTSRTRILIRLPLQPQYPRIKGTKNNHIIVTLHGAARLGDLCDAIRR